MDIQTTNRFVRTSIYGELSQKGFLTTPDIRRKEGKKNGLVHVAREILPLKNGV